MRAHSASTCAEDPYRAGMELAETLRPHAPEVIFLFSTIHYGETPDLLEGLYDGLDNDQLVVVGNTGDGFYETGGVGDVGAAALGLNSGGRVHWHLIHQAGLEADPEQATRQALGQIHTRLQGERPAFVFLACNFRVDASVIERVLEDETDYPVIGGLAADDNQMQGCALYANRQVHTEGLVMLAVDGPVSFDIRVNNTLTPVGQPGNIDLAEGSDVYQISGAPAMDFIVRETGKAVLPTDGGLTSLSIVNPDQTDVTRLRSIVPQLSSSSSRHLSLYGGIAAGKQIQVCLAQPEQLVTEVLALAARTKQQGLEPVAALVISCAGRKLLLGTSIHHEVSALTEQFGEALPLVGFPSFGEFAPVETAQGYSRNLFHNMTYVVLLIAGEA